MPIVRRIAADRTSGSRVTVARETSLRTTGMGAIGPDVHLPSADWPKFLDPWGEHYNAGPDPHNTTAQETWWLVKSAPKTPEDLYAAILDHIGPGPTVHAEGMEAIYAASDALKKEAAARGKKADAAVSSMAEAASFLGGPEMGEAMELAWKGFKALGKILYGGSADTPEDIARLSNTYKVMMQEGFPPPWGIFGYAASSSAGEIADSLESTLAKFRALPGVERTIVRQAWALMMLHAKDPPVEDMFNALAWKDGSASEKQVFYLARTLAVVHGLDERDLFVRLYNSAGDWRSRPDLLTARADPEDFVTPGIVKVDNAGVVQWVTISQAAFALVDGTAGGAKVPSGLLLGDDFVRQLQLEKDSGNLVSGSALGWAAGVLSLAGIVGGLYYARRVRGWEL